MTECPVINKFVRALSRRFADRAIPRLWRNAPSSPEITENRQFLCADAAVRLFANAACLYSEREEFAKKLSSLEPITSKKTALDAWRVCLNVRDDFNYAVAADACECAADAAYLMHSGVATYSAYSDVSSVATCLVECAYAACFCAKLKNQALKLNGEFLRVQFLKDLCEIVE